MWKRNNCFNKFQKSGYAILFISTVFSHMKKFIGSLFLASLLVSGVVHAEKTNATASAEQLVSTRPGSGSGESTSEQLHQDLRKLKATMEKALNEMDIDTVIENVTDDVVFTTMNGDVARGRDGIRKYFEAMLKGPNPRVTSLRTQFEADELSHLYGSNMAVAFGSSKDHYSLAGGDVFDVNARWSGTMIRRDGRWLIANFHYSTNMFDNPVLHAQRRFMLLGAVGASVVLMLLSFLVGRAYGRRLNK